MIGRLYCGLCEKRPAYRWPDGKIICRECAEKYFPEKVAAWDKEYGLPLRPS
jgi:hypothetical protein